MLGPLATAGSVVLETDPGKGIPPVALDEKRILQVIWNLIGNALKFTPPGGRVRLECRAMAEEIRFAVMDTSSGIPAEHLQNVFRPFWQGNAQDRREVGLGLSLVRSIVEAHGGRIWVESVEGEGSTFIFTVPSTEPVGSLATDHGQAPVFNPEMETGATRSREPQIVEAQRNTRQPMPTGRNAAPRAPHRPGAAGP